MSARLLLLRHGEIKANRQGRWHGETDSPLTGRGRRQARRTARFLSREEPGIERVYTSPMQRCQDTAGFVGMAMHRDIEVADGLSEMSIGAWEDMRFRDLENDYQLIKRLTVDPDFTPPDGENLNQVANRVTAELRAIDQRHDGQTVLVVSHGVAMAVTLAVLLDGSPAKWVNYHFHNCGLTEFVLTPEPVVYTFNQHGHL